MCAVWKALFEVEKARLKNLQKRKKEIQETRENKDNEPQSPFTHCCRYGNC